MSIDLDAIEARVAAATPGPWEARALAYSTCVGKVGEYQNLARLGDPLDRQAWRNADLIAHAPEDLAALVAEVRTLRRVNEARQRNNEKLSAKAAGLLAENERLRAVADALVSARGNRCSGSGVGLYEVAPHALAALDAWRGGDET